LFPLGGAIQEMKPVTFALSELPVGGVKTIPYGGVKAMVIRTPQSVRAFSLICTHLGCTVEWQADKQEFYCPCHDGRYDQFGEVIAGPPPVPLEEFPVKVSGDQVVVGES
jgi:Rieske Fe-S protein